jgi:hypothetical protein
LYCDVSSELSDDEVFAAKILCSVEVTFPLSDHVDQQNPSEEIEGTEGTSQVQYIVFCTVPTQGKAFGTFFLAESTVTGVLLKEIVF